MPRKLSSLLVAAVALVACVLAGPHPASAAVPSVRVGVLSSSIANGMDGTHSTRVRQVTAMLSADLGASQVSVISDDDVRSLARLSQYDCVVLVRQIPLDSAMRTTLRDYVARGGGVVAMFGAGRTDYAAGGSPVYEHLIHRWSWPNTGYQWLWWEWGEVSELYHATFVNDPLMASGFRLNGAAPGAHPILAACAAALGSGSPLSFARAGADYNEGVTLYPGSANVTRLLTYSTPSAGNGTAAGWAVNYGLGRLVYYGFQLYDIAQSGNAQARTLLAQSVRWAANPALVGAAPTYGSQSKAPVLASSASFSSGSVRLSSSVRNAGGLPLRGPLWGEVRDPAGVVRRGPYRTGTLSLKPGSSYAAAWSLSIGTRPAAGRWTARTGYQYYDWMRGGNVSVYRDVYLRSNGVSMAYAGASTSYSAVAPAAGPGIEGADRYHVSASISATGWASGPGAGDAVVLVTGTGFADALAAGPLAGKLDAPILLTPRAGLSPYVAAELRRIYAGRSNAVIYAVGGPLNMPPEVVREASAVVASALAPGGAVSVRTLSGADDFALARAVAGEVGVPSAGPFAGTAIIASYSAYADALSIAPLAARHHVPILFVTSTTVPQATRDALSALGVRHCLVVGGSGTVGTAVEGWLEANGYRVAGVADNSMASPDTRLSGATRWDVSVNALRYGVALGGMDASTLYVASGLVWPDALAAGPLGGRFAHPVLLVNGADLNFSPSVARYMASRHAAPPSVVFFGGTGTVSTFARGQVGLVLGTR